MVRTKKEGWLQGFITLTTFTTWHKDFEWNSLVKEAGISDDDKRAYRWDYDNKLASALQAQERDGDPNGEGIVWDRVAEVSLLGALGCGSQLLQLLIDELETGEKYDYLVLQATDNAVGFYEKMGFTRVGAICKPDLEAVAEQHAEAQRQREAKALERERQRQGRLVDKEVVKSERERQLVEAAKKNTGAWREACKLVLQQLLESPDASRIKWPTTVPQEQIAASLTHAQSALETQETAKKKKEDKDEVKYRDTSHFVCDVTRLLTLAEAQCDSDEIHTACSNLKRLFKSAWQQVGEHKVAADTSSKRFFIYIDVLWESKQGFRLYEVHGEVEDKGPNKVKILTSPLYNH